MGMGTWRGWDESPIFWLLRVTETIVIETSRLNTPSAVRFREISKAVLNDIIWLTKIVRNSDGLKTVAVTWRSALKPADGLGNTVMTKFRSHIRHNWFRLVNSCIYYACQTNEVYQVLPYSVDFKALRELWNPLSKTVLSEMTVKFKSNLYVGPTNISPNFWHRLYMYI